MGFEEFRPYAARTTVQPQDLLMDFCLGIRSSANDPSCSLNGHVCGIFMCKSTSKQSRHGSASHKRCLIFILLHQTRHNLCNHRPAVTHPKRRRGALLWQELRVYEVTQGVDKDGRASCVSYASVNVWSREHPCSAGIVNTSPDCCTIGRMSLPVMEISTNDA